MIQTIESLYEHAWTYAQLGEALEVAARRAHLVHQVQPAPIVPTQLASASAEELDRWVMGAADSLGLEAEPVIGSFQDLVSLVERGAPALLRLPLRTHTEQSCCLALVGRGREPLVLGPDLRQRPVNPEIVAEAIGYPFIANLLFQADFLLDQANIPAARRPKARRLIIEQQLGNLPLPCGWLLRVAPSASILSHARATRLWQPLAELFAAQLAQFAVLLVVWTFIGRITLTSGAGQVWLQGWALAFLLSIPVLLWLSSAQNRFAVKLGILFRQRLLFGTLQLHPDQIRHQGIGGFFERIMLADQVELLGLSGGIGAALALLQLISALVVLALGAGGIVQAFTLFVFILAALGLAFNYAQRTLAWDNVYRELTNNLVERMIGHRTRLAQQNPADWHAQEDDELTRYLNMSERYDRSGSWMEALPRLWIVAGIAGLVPNFLTGAASPTAIAISLGGVLVGFGALTAIATGFKSLVGVAAAWRKVGPLFNAASQYKPLTPAALEQLSVDDSAARARNEPVVRARKLTYRYREHARPVLNGIDLEIFAGDRVLLEGPSGGGKTTLAAVLAGLRQPESGMVLTRGLARASVENESTRRRIVMAPQFHENYIFSATMAFNLLMGRRWPPTDEDVAEAFTLCRELGLGELLERMPSGMSQMVGDSGWQLSHGERSRIFIARALLQRADLLILDESFGALDPENLKLALETTLRRAPTLMVIAHP